MPHARIDGLDLYYEDHGTGPHTVVMAHGALGSVAFAESVRAHLALDGLALNRVSICGTSMGATSALLFARAHPTRVERLVLRSPAPFGADMIPVRRGLSALALSYQVLGTSLTARRSGEILYDRLPNATLCIAPTDSYRDSRLELTADLIAAFVIGATSFLERAAVAEGFTIKRS